jgi:hypothetical protein
MILMRKMSFLVLLFFSVACFAGAESVEARKTKAPRPPQRLSFSSVTVNTPFEETIDILRNSTKPPLKIVVMWRDLQDNADVYRHTPVGIEGMSGIKAGTALKLVLRSISTGAASQVDYVVKEGIIIIGTNVTIGKHRMVRRVYDVSYLTSPAVGYGPVYPSFVMGGYGGFGGAYGGGGFGNMNGAGVFSAGSRGRFGQSQRR